MRVLRGARRSERGSAEPMTVVSCSIDERYVNPLFEVFDGGDFVLSSWRDVESPFAEAGVYLPDGADADEAVGGDGHADAGRADEDAAVCAAVHHALGDFAGVVGVVNGGLVECSAIFDFNVPVGFQGLEDRLLEREATMVTAKCDFQNLPPNPSFQACRTGRLAIKNIHGIPLQRKPIRGARKVIASPRNLRYNVYTLFGA